MKVVSAVCEEREITRIWNISHSPDLNPIEAVFSQVKRVFNKHRLTALANNREFDMK